MDPRLDAICINASRGPLWAVTDKQVGLVAGVLDEMIEDIAESVLGVALSKNYIRERIRIPFYGYLFESAAYEGGMWCRTKPIVSTRDLTMGEASALIEFFGGKDKNCAARREAWDALADWVEEFADDLGLPRSEVMF
jgi:hypothetical protein